MTGVLRVPTGGWRYEETAWGGRWRLDCQLGFVLADVVQCSGGYDWRALPDGETKMIHGKQPSLEAAQAAAEQTLDPRSST